MNNSMFLLLVFAALVFVPLIWWVGNYNKLIRLRNHLRESWSGIDTELKRRHDLIPNLVKTVKAYAAHEQSVLTAVIEARNQASAHSGNPQTQADRENQLIRALGPLFGLRESYPALTSDQQFLALQKELINTENRIQAARRFYNANVRDLNNRIEMFPSSLVANAMNIRRADHFEVDALERALPSVD